ncbi:hypothetical protein Hanom_Chr08g00758031 [Helianthus anomalus]
MFSNLSRSCVLGWTSEHGMRRRIMLKSPCIKHLTRVRQITPVRRQTTPILADSSDRSTDLKYQLSAIIYELVQYILL